MFIREPLTANELGRIRSRGVRALGKQPGGTVWVVDRARHSFFVSAGLQFDPPHDEACAFVWRDEQFSVELRELTYPGSPWLDNHGYWMGVVSVSQVGRPKWFVVDESVFANDLFEAVTRHAEGECEARYRGYVARHGEARRVWREGFKPEFRGLRLKPIAQFRCFFGDDVDPESN